MFSRLMRHIIKKNELDCAIASRYIAGSHVHGKAFTRVLMSETFSMLVNLLFWLGIRDTQCGAKVLRHDAVKKILPDLRIKNMAFDVNLLVALKRKKFAIDEVAIDWQDDTKSSLTGKAHITSLLMVWSLVRMRISLSPFQGMYRAIGMRLDRWLWEKVMKQNWEEF